MAGLMKKEREKKKKVKQLKYMEKEDIPSKDHRPPLIRNRIICNHVSEISHNNQYSDWATKRMADHRRYVF